MQFVRACTCAVVTAVLAGVGAEAHAFGHLHRRHACCGGGCHVGLIGHLHAKFHRHGCSSCGSWSCGGCDSCGLGGCGGCASGDCGSGCSSCGSGGCGSGDCGGGCSDCGGDAAVSTGETLAPTPAAPLAPTAPTSPPPSPEPSARRGSAIRQASLSSTSADAFDLYFAAVAQRQAGNADADATLAQAVAAEQAQPLQGWGRRMQRVQGNSRLWLEAARRQAGL